MNILLLRPYMDLTVARRFQEPFLHLGPKSDAKTAPCAMWFLAGDAIMESCVGQREGDDHGHR